MLLRRSVPTIWRNGYSKRAVVLRSRISPLQLVQGNVSLNRLTGFMIANTSGHGLRAFCEGRGLLHMALPGVLVPPLVFVGLALTLWLYKCCMMVIFQNKIIYMPSVPPFSRREKISDYANLCRPVSWEEKRIRSLDGTVISLCVGSFDKPQLMRLSSKGQHTVVLYFQGNASSTPPRLPLLSKFLIALDGGASRHYSIVALSYRGYWTSRGRASQKGIELDALAALRWIQETYCNNGEDNRLVLWGQSIGAGVATTALMQNLSSTEASGTAPVKVHGLILETPFVSIRSMLADLYPQKWLPYQYLWPFLRNWWDSEVALRAIGATCQGKSLPILIISAAKDEVVPSSHADRLEKLGVDLGLNMNRQKVPGALHADATSKPEGQKAVVAFLRKVSDH